ncbi:SRPBCC family protein [Derxia gummosa]|uniref:SRPBCC family protein n=1 Tax=Derxia gummosa DSM 723 TaxID=1121388 RepID=A0A8B6X8V2_9BURK|nr:SRPBCC family protein [Derxia gummosa]
MLANLCTPAVCTPAALRVAACAAALAGVFAAPSAQAQPKLHVEESVALSAPVGKVWQTLGSFDGLAGWHPVVAKVDITAGSNNKKGAVRSITTKDGAKLVEELLDYSASGHSMRYRVVEWPLPVSDYVSTLKVLPDGKGSRVVWSGDFVRAASAPADVDDKKAREIISGIYTSGFDGLRKALGEAAR